MTAAGAGRDDISELAWVADEGQLWMSDVTMQGHGTDQSLAIDGFAKVHAESAFSAAAAATSFLCFDVV